MPHCQSIFFSDVLRKAGCLDEFITVNGGQHGPVTFNEKTFNSMTSFFLKESSLKAESPNGKLNLSERAGTYVVEYEGKSVLHIKAQGIGEKTEGKH